MSIKSENQATLSTFCANILKSENTKATSKEVLLKQLFEHLHSEPTYTEKFVTKCKFEISKCKTYLHTLQWFTTHFLYGENLGHNQTVGKNTRKLKKAMEESLNFEM